MNKYLLSLLLFGFSITNQIICEAQDPEGGESESESETESEATEGDDTNELLVNDVTSKYFIGYYGGGEFPYATDQCQPINILGTQYYKYVCIDSNTVYQEVYSDSTCATSAGATTLFNTTKTGTGSIYDFNCDTTSAVAYAEIEFQISTCENTNAEITFAALNVCTDIGASGIKFQVYCDEDPLSAQLQSFIGDDCSLSTYSSYADANDTCGFVDVGLYGTVLNCVGSGTSKKSTITPNNPYTTNIDKHDPSTKSTITPYNPYTTNIDNHDPSTKSTTTNNPDTTNVEKGSLATTHFSVLGLILAGLVAYFRM